MSLFTGSLEKRNRKYLKDVKLQDLNNQYQKAQNDIIRELDLGLISRAETKNKLEEMQNTLREQSGATELVKQAKVANKIIEPQKEEYKPMTASEYENALRRNVNTIGQLLPDFPAVPIPETKEQRKQKVDYILSLYKDEPSKTSDLLLNEIIKTALEKQKLRNLNKTQLNNEIKKNFNEISKNPKVNKKLMNELEDAIRNINLKKAPLRESKVKTKPPFEQELEQELAKKIAQREATSSSQATTASTTSILDVIPEKEYNKHISDHSKAFRKEYEAKKGVKYPQKGNISFETMRKERAQWGQGLRKKKGKK